MQEKTTKLVERSWEFAQPIVDSISEFAKKVFGFIPNLIGALLLIFIGKFIAGKIRKGVEKLLELIKLEKFTKKFGINESLENLGLKTTFTSILGILVYWVIYLAFILAAVDVLGVQTITDIVSKLIGYIPNVIAAVIILLIGIIVANFIKDSLSHIKHGKILGKISFFAIIIFVSVSALEQIGIEISFFTDNIKIIIAGISLGIGIAFGLGGQEDAKKIIHKVLKDH